MKIITTLLALLTISSVLAQEKCATPVYNQLKNMKYPDINKKQLFEDWLKDKKLEKALERVRESTQEEIYKIPVVIHILHQGEPEGVGSNISLGQVLSQMEILNQDFRRLGPDTSATLEAFKPLAADTKIEFTLAKQGPDGNPTTGIIRKRATQSSYRAPDFFNQEDDRELKALSYWPAEDYLNIWVTNIDILGYAQFPESDLPGLSDDPEDRLTDGVVVDYRFFGEGFNADDFSKGHTTSHEVGHFLGLRHIWGDNDTCFADDFCEDTPNQRSSYLGKCPTSSQSSCESSDMFQNYMDFTDDACMNIFTFCQKERMRIVLENSPRRESLLTSPGLVPLLTLVFDLSISSLDNLPIVSCDNNLTAELTIRNQGLEAINSFDLRVFLNSDVQLLSFDNLDIDSNQEATFNLDFLDLPAPENELTLELANPNGSLDEDPTNNTISTKFLIDDQNNALPFVQDFNNEDNWSVLNFSSDGWQKVDTEIFSSEDQSFIITGFNSNEFGEEDWLISPVLNTENLTALTLFFQQSYRQQADKADQLKILGSRNCGRSFELIKTFSGEDLSAEKLNAAWAPVTAEDWQNEFIDLTGFINEPEVRFAFVFNHAGGNNLFIDNTEFFIDPNPNRLDDDFTEDPFVIYPNPATENFNITFDLLTREDVSVILYDAMGRNISSDSYLNILNQTLEFKTTPLKQGIYFVKVEGTSFERTKRVIIR